MKPKPAFSIERVAAKEATELFGLKIQTHDAELNVYLTRPELALFRAIRTADWTLRKSIRIGRVGSASAYWCSDRETVTVLVGSDDETWDFAISVPARYLAALVRIVEEA